MVETREFYSSLEIGPAPWQGRYSCGVDGETRHALGGTRVVLFGKEVSGLARLTVMAIVKWVSFWVWFGSAAGMAVALMLPPIAIYYAVWGS